MPPSTENTSSSSSSSSSSLLSDPILAPFLSPNFSASSYINSSLPPLLPPSTLSSAKATKPSAEPLSVLSSKSTTLLSTLDLHTQRLIAHLQTLTDEILRVGPRLGYEVDLLRGDVIGLGETLEITLAEDIARFSPAAAEENSESKNTSDNKGKPEVLDKLEMLSTVRSRLEDVIRIFGEAMDWSLSTSESTEEQPPVASSNHYAMSTPALPTPPSLSTNSKKSRGQNPTDEILYLLASNDITAARKKVDELKELATVFHGTIEGPARTAVVEALEERVKEEEAKEKNRKKAMEDAAGGKSEKENSLEGKEKSDSGTSTGGVSWGSGREGYYGLINQLSRMRGIS